jgi:hypothetical protein
MHEYQIVFKDGDVQYILAEDLESAAWSAYELSQATKQTLKDIIPTYVKEQILSKQVESSQEPA